MLPALRAALGYIPWRTSSHSGRRCRLRAGIGSGAAPAERRAPRHRRGPGPEERTDWWRTRRGRGYMLHTTEALAEGQSRRSGGTSADWGRRSGTGGGPEPKYIEGPAGGVMSRLRCGQSSDSDGQGLGRPWAASFDCPNGARREMPAGCCWIGLQAEIHGGPGRAGPRTKMYS